MNNSNLAIELIDISKKYRLYRKNIDKIKEFLFLDKKKYHENFFALKNINLYVKKGETLGIIGKNGSGKSTLLKIISKIVTPTTGTCKISGRISALLELGSGFNPDYTGYQNIYFQGSLLGYSKEEMDSKLDDILYFADIGQFIYQPFKSYSSGMAARLAFSVAINVEPDILIIDEALSVGDMAFQAKCYQKFKDFQKKEITILFVTHSIDLIIKHCTKAIFLESGKIIKEGNSKEVVEAYRKNITIHSVKKIEQRSQENKYKISNTMSYGNLKAKISNFKIMNREGKNTDVIYKDEIYTVEMRIKFLEDVINPIFAFTIRTVDSLELTGTNSSLLNNKIDKVLKNEKITIRFTQVMVLNSGVYLLALGCTRKNNDGHLEVLHRLYDVAELRVISDQESIGVASSPSTVRLVKN